MAAVIEVQRAGGGAGSADWSRKYPPLLALLVGMAIVLAVLPSALNLPQSNPTQTLEYAPVPPEDQNDTPPAGNVSSLGLGSSSGLTEGGAPGGEGFGDIGSGDPPEPPGRNPDFKCVGRAPKKQTKDPLAPPCVGFFEGTNYGATYQGVTGDEVRVLFYIDGNTRYQGGSDASNQVSPGDRMYDLGKPAEPGEHLVIKGLRTWQEYFNKRFQTYGRRVHFWLFFSSASTAEARRADAAKHLAEVKPFAVVSVADNGAEDDYLRAMARKGVLNFGSFGVRPASFFNSFSKMIWGYLPSVEQQAESYVSYVCQKVVPHPSVLAGGDLNNKPRKLGILHTTDKNHAGLILMADLVKKKVGACGHPIRYEATYPTCCLAQDPGDTPDYASTAMAEFKAEGVTTILWTGGANGNFGKAATGIDYYPEWIVLGDSQLEGHTAPRYTAMINSFDGRAIAVTPQTFQPALEQQRCYEAFREINSQMARSDVAYVCEYYNDLFQLFVGIQVAGPKLGPTSIDRGFHDIPQYYDGSPTVPACFYEIGDYTCVKDAQAMIYDKNRLPPGSNNPGCWKSIKGGGQKPQYGDRYAPGKWPPGNINAQIDGQEPCNGFTSSVKYAIAP